MLLQCSLAGCRRRSVGTFPRALLTFRPSAIRRAEKWGCGEREEDREASRCGGSQGQEAAAEEGEEEEAAASRIISEAAARFLSP